MNDRGMTHAYVVSLSMSEEVNLEGEFRTIREAIAEARELWGGSSLKGIWVEKENGNVIWERGDIVVS